MTEFESNRSAVWGALGLHSVSGGEALTLAEFKTQLHASHQALDLHAGQGEGGDYAFVARCCFSTAPRARSNVKTGLMRGATTQRMPAWERKGGSVQ